MEVDSNIGDNPSVNEGEEVKNLRRVCVLAQEKKCTHFMANMLSIAQHFGDDGQLENFAIECSRAVKRKKKSKANPLKPSLSTKISCKTSI
ncbi:hypothetical protein ACSBR1_010579 [Camellia fascicularis]